MQRRKFSAAFFVNKFVVVIYNNGRGQTPTGVCFSMILLSFYFILLRIFYHGKIILLSYDYNKKKITEIRGKRIDFLRMIRNTKLISEIPTMKPLD